VMNLPLVVAFFVMIGKNDKYLGFECDPFELPRQLEVAACQLKNERHFIEFLVRNDWIQRRMGLRMPKVTNGFFPDLKSLIRATKDDPKEVPINVEVEFWAENYRMHGHAFRGCDLILSFFRTPDTRFVKGVPVWSFYECYRNDKWGMLCLDRDIRYDFSEHIDVDELNAFEYMVYKRLGKDGVMNIRRKLEAENRVDDSIG
jgi:hypothetical protein